MGPFFIVLLFGYFMRLIIRGGGIALETSCAIGTAFIFSFINFPMHAPLAAVLIVTFMAINEVLIGARQQKPLGVASVISLCLSRLRITAKPVTAAGL